jgi:hypothetical protein
VGYVGPVGIAEQLDSERYRVTDRTIHNSEGIWRARRLGMDVFSKPALPGSGLANQQRRRPVSLGEQLDLADEVTHGARRSYQRQDLRFFALQSGGNSVHQRDGLQG